MEWEEDLVIAGVYLDDAIRGRNVAFIPKRQEVRYGFLIMMALVMIEGHFFSDFTSFTRALGCPMA